MPCGRPILLLLALVGWLLMVIPPMRLEAGSTPAPTAVDWLQRADHELARLAGEPRQVSAPSPKALAELPAEELQRHFAERQTRNRRQREQRAWQLVRQLAGAAAREADPLVRNAKLADCAELAVAVERGEESPVPERLDVAWGAITFWHYAINPVARGTTPASNLVPGADADLSRRQPLPSTFWQPPADLAAQDLFAGFGRRQLPDYDDAVWSYAGPKTGTGAHPGFEVRSAGRKLKVKFAEVHSEPFTARIVAAAGFHVPVVDHAPRLRVRYDRRLLREFHQRAALQTRLELLGVIPVYRLNYQRRFDPFTFVHAARLRDGSEISAAELRRRLLPRSWRQRSPEVSPDNFDREFEAQVDHLVFTEVNVEPDATVGMPLGRWSYGDLDHADRRELRGLGLLAAWLSWFDSRPVNTQLRVAEVGAGEFTLRHQITDLGGSLGRSPGFMHATWERPNDFGWRFTRPERAQGPGRMTIPFRIVGYQPVVETPAFCALTRDDARWMARWLGQISEAQITAALVAAGFDSATARLYLEKLVARRDGMIRDLGLETEVPLLRAQGVNPTFDYDPVVDGPLRVSGPGGTVVEAPVDDLWVVGGRLVPRTPGAR